LRRSLFAAIAAAIVLSAATANAGYLDRKGTFLVETKAGYQYPIDGNLKEAFDGGISFAGIGGYHISGHFAVLGKVSYRNYHLKSIYEPETGEQIKNFTFGGGVKWNITQGYLIIPYFAGYGNLARFSHSGPNGDFDTNVFQAEGFFGMEFFLLPQLCVDLSIGYVRNFGEITVDILRYGDEYPGGATKLPIRGPVEPESIVMDLGFAVFL
jgi:hypothetical protein